MVIITIFDEQWTNVKNILTNVNTFENEIYNILNQQINIKPENSKIVLPVSVTTAERHKMHILTRDGFNPKSTGSVNRYMELFITKEYFENLHNQFKIEPVTEPVIEPVTEPVTEPVIDNLVQFNTFKKAILDDIMGIVEKHLNAEFLKYYV